MDREQFRTLCRDAIETYNLQNLQNELCGNKTPLQKDQNKWYLLEFATEYKSIKLMSLWHAHNISLIMTFPFYMHKIKLFSLFDKAVSLNDYQTVDTLCQSLPVEKADKSEPDHLFQYAFEHNSIELMNIWIKHYSRLLFPWRLYLLSTSIHFIQLFENENLYSFLKFFLSHAGNTHNKPVVNYIITSPYFHKLSSVKWHEILTCTDEFILIQFLKRPEIHAMIYPEIGNLIQPLTASHRFEIVAYLKSLYSEKRVTPLLILGDAVQLNTIEKSEYYSKYNNVKERINMSPFS